MRRGRRVVAPHLVLHVMTRPEPMVPRAGFVVGKMVGNSVHRHRVIRQLRHLTAAQLPAFPPGTDIVVRALPGALSADLAAELSTLLKRAGLHA